MDAKPNRHLKTRGICLRYNISSRTIPRWIALGILPEPMRINGRLYWNEADIERCEREGMKPRAAATANQPSP
jgi:predicted site-specific integrase-resolvase